MTEDHLSLETLADLLSGEIEDDTLAREVVPHLLASCPGCEARVAEIRALQRSLGHWNESIVVREGGEAPALLAELEELASEERFLRVAQDARFQTWGLCQLLLERGREATLGAPTQAVELAELAVRVAEELVEEPYHPDWVGDLRARSWAHLGNARRVAGELHSADAAFRRADACLVAGSTGRLGAMAEILELKAALRRAQRRLPEALELLERATDLARNSDDPHDLGRALVSRAKAVEETGDLEQAGKLLEQAAARIDPHRDPRLYLCTQHNLLWVLASSGQPDRAAELLPDVRTLSRKLGNRLDLERLRWAEGRIAAARGDLEVAERILAEVQEGFLAAGSGLDAALVSLELALVYAREDRTEDLKALAGKIVPIFHAQDVHREALAALFLFQRAAERELATLELLHELAGLVRRGRI